MGRYDYDRSAVNESITSAKNAATVAETIPTNMQNASSLAANVNVEGLEFLSDTSYNEIVNVILGYESVIIGMMEQAEKDLIIECLENNDIGALVGYINDGTISTQTLIEYSKEYMINIMNSDDFNGYNRNYKSIGGENSVYSNIVEALRAQGLSEDFIVSLSEEYCKNLINNDLMYTKEGSVTMATSFIGLLSMFNLKLGYENTEFDKSYDGFYFGDGDTSLSALDCCNFTDWIARCVGVDIYAWNAAQKYNYVNGKTPSDEVLADITSAYFKNAEPGDYLSSSTHIMLIVANDGKGYYYAHESGSAEIRYMTYEELSAKGIKVTNTEALFNNTANVYNGEYVWLDENGNLASNINDGVQTQKTQIFALPQWYANQANINLTDEEYQSLVDQYNKRNQNGEFNATYDKTQNTYSDYSYLKEKEYTTPSLNEEVDKVDQIGNTGSNDLNNNYDNSYDNNTGYVDTDDNYQVDDGFFDNSPNIEIDENGSITVQRINILPDNKFSDYMPKITSGRLGSMSISKTFVSYEIKNTDIDIYDKYNNDLLKLGYKEISDGVYQNENYKVLTTYNNGIMTIKLEELK